MLRPLIRAALVGTCLTALMSLAAAPVAANDATVGTTDESWYQVAGCTTVTCAAPAPPAAQPPPPAPRPTAPGVNPFPAGTLHVGILGGQEQYRSYIKLNLVSLPFDAMLEGGTLTLPIVDEEQSGTANLEAAKLQVCFMEKPFQGGDAGVVATPPEADCGTKAAANLITQANAKLFTVDLKLFAQRWAAGEANNGLALIVTDAAKQAGETWQVAISGKGFNGPQIAAKLIFSVPPRPEVPVTLPSLPVPPLYTPPLSGIEPEAPSAAPPVLPAPRGAAIFSRGADYYLAIFLLPLAGMALCGLLGYSLTRDVAARTA